VIEFDVETTGLQWYADDLFMAQFLGDPSAPDRAIAAEHPRHRNEIQTALNVDQGYRAWNAKFDLHFLRAAGYTLPPESQWHDGMVLAHICDERSSIALKVRAEKLFGPGERDEEKAVKAWLDSETKRRRAESKDNGTELVRPNYADVPSELMVPYAKQDVVLQRNLCRVYERQIERVPDLKAVYDLEQKVLGALFWMEVRGLPVDRAGAVRFEAQLIEDLERLEDECIKLAGIDTFNPGSSDQIAEALKRRGADLSRVGKTPSGKIKMDEEALNTVHDELAEKILEFRSTRKLFSTNLNPMLHPVSRGTIDFAPYLTSANRVHTNFRQVGTRTGRMSSGDPNIQNWHRDDLRLRDLVCAEEGKVLVTADLDAIEARLMAAYAGEGDLKRLLVEGGDIHVNTAQRVGLRERKRASGAVESTRQRGKTFNYLMMFGGGVRSIMKTFGVSQADARQMKNRYESAYPEIVELSRRVEFNLVDRGFIKTAWGRRQRPYGSKAHEIEREAYKFTNYLIQGTAADLMKESMVKCHEAGIPLIASVHDELVAECDEADAPEVARELERALTDHPRITDTIPLGAEAQIVKRWSHAKDPEYVPPYRKD
jgi:DNA polymerase-1